MREVDQLNTAEGMSDEELDVWADIFHQAKVVGVTKVTFSQFIQNPFAHLSPALEPAYGDPNRNARPTLYLAHSVSLSISDPKMVPNRPPKRPFSRNDEEAT